MWKSNDDVGAIINNQALKQITDTSAIERIIDEIMAQTSEQVTHYR